jgi:hypothetical protein
VAAIGDRRGSHWLRTVTVTSGTVYGRSAQGAPELEGRAIAWSAEGEGRGRTGLSG